MRSASVLAVMVLAVFPPSLADAFSCNDLHYRNSSGHVIHSPSCGRAEEGRAAAVFRDGSVSYSEHHRGTCSRHGGVARWN